MLEVTTEEWRAAPTAFPNYENFMELFSIDSVAEVEVSFCSPQPCADSGVGNSRKAGVDSKCSSACHS